MAVPISIFTTDADLIVRSWDSELARITGISADAARGQRLTALVPDLEARVSLNAFQQVLTKGVIETLDPLKYPYLIPCPPFKSARHFQQMQQRVTIAPLREQGKIVGTVVTIEDITAQLDYQQDLAAQLASEHEATRLQAVQELATANAIAAEEMLVKALGDESWRVRRAAVDSLSERGGATMATTLLRSLREEHRNPSVLNSVLQVLGHSQVDTVPALIDCLFDPNDVDLRIYAALALGEQGDRRAIPSLIRALEDSDLNVCYHAIDALGHLKAIEAVENLVQIAESGNFFLAFPALDALTRIGDITIIPRLIPLLADNLLQTAVVETLGALGDPTVVKPLVELLNQPYAPACAIAQAIANLYDRYESLYQEGSYITDLVHGTLNASGKANVTAALEEATEIELRALVLLLGQLEGREVEHALTKLLAQKAVRSSVVEALVRYGKRVTHLLIEQLKAEDVEIRYSAVVALGRTGDPRAVSALTQLLSSDPELMIVTAGALAQIGDRRAFNPLLSLMGHRDAAVRQAVVAALNSLGHPDLASHIVKYLQDSDSYVRESAVKIAGYFAFPECIPLLLERCHDGDENVRRAAVELLPYLEDQAVVPTLVAALETETPKVRAATARALGQIDSAIALPYLMKALQDSDAWVRYYATRAIGIHGYAAAVEPLAHLLKVDPAHQVRAAAIEALGRIGGARSAAILAPFATDLDGNRDLIRAALKALGEIAHPNALPPVLAALRSPELEFRLYAIRALGKRGGMGVEAALQGIATIDREPEAIGAAIEALADLATPDAIAALLELCVYPSCVDACVAALVKLGTVHIDAIARGLNHRSPDVRHAVVTALTRMKHPFASELLIRALEDEDRSVRLAAVIALEHLGNLSAERKLAVLAHTDPDPAVRRAAQRTQI